MNLSNSIISQFVKMTNDSSRVKDQTKTYGTIVKSEDTTYVQLDGSDLMTPIDTTVHVNDGDRVTVTVKNHNVTVDGNLSDISASNGVVSGINNDVIAVSDTVNTINIDVSGVTDSVNTVRQQADEIESSVNTMMDDTNNRFLSTNQSINELMGRTLKLESEMDAVQTTIESGINRVYEGEISTNVCGMTIVNLEGNTTTNYLVELNIKSYNFGDDWTNIVTQKACVYVSTKTETSFTITTDIIGLNISDGSQITTGTAEIQYSLIL